MIPDTNLNNLTLFLVEPSSTQSNIIKNRLQEVGVTHIQTFENAKQALSAMRGQPPDITISAMYLSDMTGADLAVAIRTDDALKTVAFILVSSIDDPKQLDLVRQAGACAILPKPFSKEELRLALDNALDYLNLGQLDIAGDIEHIRALIVDDSRSARIFLRHALEAMGIQLITEVEDGKKGTEIVMAQQFDIVFTDLNMPEMDGGQLTQFIRTKSWQSYIPIILISSEGNQERLATLRELGVSGICYKPFEPSILKSMIESVLN